MQEKNKNPSDLSNTAPNKGKKRFLRFGAGLALAGAAFGLSGCSTGDTGTGATNPERPVATATPNGETTPAQEVTPTPEPEATTQQNAVSPEVPVATSTPSIEISPTQEADPISASEETAQQSEGEALTDGAAQLEKDYPILSILPIEARLYVVNSCKSVKYPNDKTKIALCVDVAQDGLEEYVYKDIQSRGYNPADFEIIFKNISDTEDWD